MSNIMHNTISSYNATTGELVCCAPSGKVVLQIVEPDLYKSQDISKAIQDAYKAGVMKGRADLMRKIKQIGEDA